MVRAGMLLGWGMGTGTPTDPEYTTEQKFYLTDFLNSACRRVYKARVGGRTYDWSWLRPTSLVTLASGESTIPLPADFGGLEGNLTVVSPTNAFVYPVRMGSAEAVDSLLASGLGSGRPGVAAVRWLKGTTHNTGQRAELVISPAADAEYTLKLTYYVLPDALTDAFPYALGGPNMAEVYLEGILAVAEQRLDNKKKGDRDEVHQTEFEEQLAAAIDQDRRFKPAVYGRNTDRSDDCFFDRGAHVGEYVTFEGVLYGV
jgi:hypothetical protein